jgi:hypothetical protein
MTRICVRSSIEPGLIVTNTTGKLESSSAASDDQDEPGDTVSGITSFIQCPFITEQRSLRSSQLSKSLQKLSKRGMLYWLPFHFRPRFLMTPSSPLSFLLHLRYMNFLAMLLVYVGACQSPPNIVFTDLPSCFETRWSFF